MLKKGLKFTLIITLMLSAAVSTKSQITETQAEKLAGSNKCLIDLTSNKPDFLRFVRDEELEDYLFDLQEKDYKNLVKAAYIFRVNSTGIFITPSNEIVHVTATSNKSKIIAVLKKNGEVFPLYGCRDAKDNFQNLIIQTKIRLNSVSDAEVFGYLFYRLVEDPDLTRIVYTPREFRHKVENYFFDNFDETQAKEKFNLWQRSFAKFNGVSEMGIVTKDAVGNYFVSITFFSRFQNEIPTLKKIIILPDVSGIYRLQNPESLFPISSTPSAKTLPVRGTN